MITSKDNEKIRAAAKLVNSSKQRRKSGKFVMEGVRLCSEALRENLCIHEMYYTADAFSANKELVENLSAKAQFCSEVSKPVFAKMSDTEAPQGIMLIVSVSGLNNSFEGFKKGKYLAFERVSDPSNLGAAARTAEALGLNGIILSNSSADPYSPKSLRASMGALIRLPVFCTDDFFGALEELKKRGFEVSGTVVHDNAYKVGNIPFGEKEIVVIGNEANGLSEPAKQLCTRLVTIPMSGRAESLNAAAAATIVMWEMSK